METHLSTGETVRSSFVMATGCLSAPIEPAIEGLRDFAGDTMFTNRFPKGGYDFTGKRVAVVGTGSSGVQSIPVIAEQADQLYVLQRSAAYTIPSPNRVLGPGELEALKAEYPEIRKAQWSSPIGSARFGAVFQGAQMPNILDTPVDEQLQRVDKLGVVAAFVWADVRKDIDANHAAGGSTPRASSASCRIRGPRRHSCRSTRSAASARSSTRATSRRSTAPTCRSSTCGPGRSPGSCPPGSSSATAPSSSSTPSCTPPASTP